MSQASITKQLQSKRQEKLEGLKAMVWDLQPKLMNLFRQDPVLIELEETLDTVKEYFLDDAKKDFKSEADEIDILNKNGHFAYVCSRMEYYKELEKKMGDDTNRINKVTNRAKGLVHKLTNFELDKDFLRRKLTEEFKKRNLLKAEPRVQVPQNPNRINLDGAKLDQPAKPSQSKQIYI
jgi:hypothetical protein